MALEPLEWYTKVTKIFTQPATKIQNSKCSVLFIHRTIAEHNKTCTKTMCLGTHVHITSEFCAYKVGTLCDLAAWRYTKKLGEIRYWMDIRSGTIKFGMIFAMFGKPQTWGQIWRFSKLNKFGII